MERQGRVLLFMLFAACMLGCEEGRRSSGGVTVSNRLDQTINVRYRATEYHAGHQQTRWESVNVNPGDTVTLELGPGKPNYFIEVNTATGVTMGFHVSDANPVLVVTPAAMGL